MCYLPPRVSVSEKDRSIACEPAFSRRRSGPSRGSVGWTIPGVLRLIGYLFLSLPAYGAEPPPDLYTPSRDSVFVLERFTYPDQLGQFPKHWEGRAGWRQSRTKDADDLYYTIQVEDGDYYLKAETQGRATNAGRAANVNLRLYSKLRWRWRVHKLPEAGNEGAEETNDSAASVRLVFRGGMFPKTLKYVWSTTMPVGAETNSPSSDKTKVVVLRSGAGSAGEWVWEEVDAYDDYKRLFGGEPRLVQALAVLSDSDNTNSPVAADYDDFVFFIGLSDETDDSIGTIDEPGEQ
jgi:hypothetical protein